MRRVLSAMAMALVLFANAAPAHASDGTLQWAYATGKPVVSSPAIGNNTAVYAGSLDNSVYAINPDGTLKWAYPTRGAVYSSPAVGSDGTIYAGSLDKNFYAINPDGTLKWAYPTGAAVNSSPAIGSDGTIYVGSGGYDSHRGAYGTLNAINPDGTLKWSYLTGARVTTSPAIGSDGTLYASFANGTLNAINPDGTLDWSYDTGDPLVSQPAIDVDGTVYVGSGVYLNAIYPDGTLKWAYAMGNSVASSPAINIDGTVCVGSDDGSLYSINPDGGLNWSYEIGSAVESSPAIGDDGTVYVGADDGNIYAIYPDGSLKWSYATDDIVRSSPAIGGDGTIYVGSNDGNLYAIDSSGGPLAATPWPKFRGNCPNTGRYPAPETTASATGYTFGGWSSAGSVNVTLHSVDDFWGSGVAAGYPMYCVDTANSCIPDTSYSSAFSVSCATASACTQYVRYFAQDNAGNTEIVKSSIVNQDLQAPVTTATALGAYAFGNSTTYSSVSVSLSASDGFGSGVAAGYPKYCVDTANSCVPGTSYTGSFLVNCAAAGTCTQHVRYQAKDNKGNTEAVKSSAVIQHVPLASVSINNGAVYTKNKTVSLNLYATDDVGVWAYFKSNSSKRPDLKSNWISVNTTAILNTPVSHKLAGKAGTDTVYVWYIDNLSNIYAASDSIIYDNVAPVNGIVNATASTSGQITLKWSGFTDSDSGIAGYKVAYATGKKAPKNCSLAQASTSDLSYIHTGLTNSSVYSYRVCAVDNVGNVSKGVTVNKLVVK